MLPGVDIVAFCLARPASTLNNLACSGALGQSLTQKGRLGYIWSSCPVVVFLSHRMKAVRKKGQTGRLSRRKEVLIMK